MTSQTNKKLISILSLLILDYLWIYLFMNNKYKKLVLNIQKTNLKVNIYSAIGAYLLMIYLLLEIVIKYNLSYIETFIFGFSIYGIYDLTCGAIFKNWDFQLALIDMIWGGFVYTTTLYIYKNI